LNGAPLCLPVNPWVVSASDGQAFDAGFQPATHFLNLSGVGHWGKEIRTNFNSHRGYGTAVSYAPGKVMIAGGDNPPTATAEIIELNDSNTVWSYTNSMANPRRQPNATILPDGTVLVTGGSSGPGFNNHKFPVLAAELWNPNTGAWTTLASSTVYRGYDSIALLLPDGRVLTAGGSNASGEIFSPPYLFNGARPTITSAPTQVNFGQTFTVTSPQAAGITNVNWVSLSSVTHGFNAGQHFNQLNFTHVSGGLHVTAPSDPGNAA